MEIRFDGKKALVTGGGKGIGRAIAKALWTGGAETYVISWTQSDLDSLEVECPTIKTILLDMRQYDDVRKAVQDIGPVNYLVNNAGGGREAPFLDTSLDDYDITMDTNVKSVFNISQAVAKLMVEHKQGGSIVNISSIASSRMMPYSLSVYSASKAALDHLTRCMAVELGPHQIRVNAVNPTLVLTENAKKFVSAREGGKKFRDRTPLDHFAQEADVVQPVLYLLSDKSDMINGAILPIDGGYLCTWTGYNNLSIHSTHMLLCRAVIISSHTTMVHVNY